MLIMKRKLFNAAGMNLRQFLSNDVRFNESVRAETRQEVEETKVLGISWNVNNDVVIVQRNEIWKGEKSDISFHSFNIQSDGINNTCFTYMCKTCGRRIGGMIR